MLIAHEGISDFYKVPAHWQFRRRAASDSSSHRRVLRTRVYFIFFFYLDDNDTVRLLCCANDTAAFWPRWTLGRAPFSANSDSQEPSLRRKTRFDKPAEQTDCVAISNSPSVCAYALHRCEMLTCNNNYYTCYGNILSGRANIPYSTRTTALLPFFALRHTK